MPNLCWLERYNAKIERYNAEKDLVQNPTPSVQSDASDDNVLVPKQLRRLVHYIRLNGVDQVSILLKTRGAVTERWIRSWEVTGSILSTACFNYLSGQPES